MQEVFTEPNSVGGATAAIERGVGFLKMAQVTWATGNTRHTKECGRCGLQTQTLWSRVQKQCAQLGLVGKAEGREAYIEETEAGKL